jgi:hypothetical protein
MKIPDISQLPDGQGASGWARDLRCDTSTIRRAIQKKEIEVKRRRGHTVISKRSILKWLGIGDEIVLERPTLRNLRKAGKAYAAAVRSSS